MQAEQTTKSHKTSRRRSVRVRSCNFVDRSCKPGGMERSTKSHERSRKDLSVMRVRAILLICVVSVSCWLGVVTVRGQEVIDKFVATVNASGQTDCGNTCLITYSDLIWQLALQPDTPLVNPSSEALNRALRLVIDQRLILQEAEKLPTIEPTPEEIAKARDELVKAFPSPSAFQERLQRVGLTADKLNEILDQRVRIEKYLNFRFRNFVVITDKESVNYYNQVYVPRFRARHPGAIVPKLEEVRDEIQKTLEEAKIESDIDAFLDNARERAEIVTLNPV